MTESRSSRHRAVRRDAALNREKLLTVAAELISRRGPSVPLTEIAAAAGVGVGTFYRGYPDRTALLHALEHRAYAMLEAVLDEITASGETSVEAIETYLRRCLDLGDQLVLPLRGAPPLIDSEALAARNRIAATLERFLADGRADGTIRPDVVATDIVICAALLTQPLPRTSLWSTFADRHLTLFVSGLRPTGGAPLAGPAPGDLESLLREPLDPDGQPATT
ncbi:TetR/AcrR family transcriptional regulator [Nocardia goodfellowii]|uniref:AcrR family transcriptional regulator n=1 Tax=Nocardia goodfellowii TaxID=882446 RepID=A0ABS4QN71_9NOCA|nr:TetR/AcrR family transcriptional regulator [Nocardia goodfellowii]MBP2193156.1 AcrR family transcriptional regulator [Nocardia goodfellowii]